MRDVFAIAAAAAAGILRGLAILFLIGAACEAIRYILDDPSLFWNGWQIPLLLGSALAWIVGGWVLGASAVFWRKR